MRVHHPEAKREFCDKPGILHNKRRGEKREVEDVIVANNCCKVVEVSGCVTRRKRRSLTDGLPVAWEES